MHNVLHGFRAGRGMGKTIMELKLAQELASIDQDPLFLVLLDLNNAYDSVDWDHLLVTLEGYGVSPQLCGLLETFWDCHQVVPRQNFSTDWTSPPQGVQCRTDSCPRHCSTWWWKIS